MSQSTAAAPVKAVSHVLFINSLGPSYPFTTRIDEAISGVLSQRARTPEAALQLQPGTKHLVMIGGVGLLCLIETLLLFGLLWQRQKKGKVEQFLFERLTFETLVSDFSATLSLPETQIGPHADIEKNLGQILEFLKLNRIAVFATDRGKPELIVSVVSPGERVESAPRVAQTNDFEWATLSLRGGGVLVSDLNDLPEESSTEREYLRSIGVVSVATFPLKSGDESFGWILFLSTTRRVLWIEELVKRLRILAEIFSNALMRKRAQEALAKLSSKLIDAQERERSRIARDLHDDICQRLTLLSLEIEHSIGDSGNTQARTERMQETWEHCSEIASDVQALSHELHPSMLDLLGLTAAMKNFCREFSQQQDVLVEFANTDVPDALPRNVSLSLFRVAQEALHNAAKHSTANFFEVRLQGTPDGIELEVHDAGVGFDVENVQKKGGLGLSSMQERIHIVKGTLAIDSKANCGTRIRAKVPLLAEMNTKHAPSKNVKAEVGETAWRRRTQIVQTGQRSA